MYYFWGRGFIGSEFVRQLTKLGHDIYIPERDDEKIYKKNLGVVIYSAGYGDCENKPYNVLEANTILLSSILEKATFEKLIYISSTRVYMNQENSLEEGNVTICRNDNRRLFNLTKLVSEELCLKSSKDTLIIRPSNVYGLSLDSQLFLPSIIKDSINKKIVNMYVDENYEKDYISVFDLVFYTIELVKMKNPPPIVNIASGKNITSKNIADILIKQTNCKVIWHNKNFSLEKFPITNIDFIKNNIMHDTKNVLLDLVDMIEEYKNALRIKNEQH
nr:SDR family oxidoreductase [Providencia rettgeri]